MPHSDEGVYRELLDRVAWGAELARSMGSGPQAQSRWADVPQALRTVALAQDTRYLWALVGEAGAERPEAVSAARDALGVADDSAAQQVLSDWRGEVREAGYFDERHAGLLAGAYREPHLLAAIAHLDSGHRELLLSGAEDLLAAADPEERARAVHVFRSGSARLFAGNVATGVMTDAVDSYRRRREAHRQLGILEGLGAATDRLANRLTALAAVGHLDPPVAGLADVRELVWGAFAEEFGARAAEMSELYALPSAVLEALGVAGPSGRRAPAQQDTVEDGREEILGRMDRFGELLGVGAELSAEFRAARLGVWRVFAGAVGQAFHRTAGVSAFLDPAAGLEPLAAEPLHDGPLRKAFGGLAETEWDLRGNALTREFMRVWAPDLVGDVLEAHGEVGEGRALGLLADGRILETLADRITREPLEVPERARVQGAVGRAQDAAQAAGVDRAGPVVADADWRLTRATRKLVAQRLVAFYAVAAGLLTDLPPTGQVAPPGLWDHLRAHVSAGAHQLRGFVPARALAPLSPPGAEGCGVGTSTGLDLAYPAAAPGVDVLEVRRNLGRWA